MVERFLVTDNTVLRWILANLHRGWGRILARDLERNGGLSERQIAFTREYMLNIPDRVTRRRIIARQMAYEALKDRSPRNRLSRAMSDASQKRWNMRREAREALAAKNAPKP